MVLADIRSRLSAQLRGMAIQNRDTPLTGTTSPNGAPHGSPRDNQTNPASSQNLTSILFKLTAWARLGVRTRFRILDIVLNCALLTPLAVLFQVSASGLQDFLFLNHVPGYIGTLLLLSIAFTIEFGCSYWQKYLSSIRYVKDRDPDEIPFIVATRLYHFAIGFANVCHYRGVGDVFYYLMGSGQYAALQMTTTTVVLLLALRCTRNVLGPPLCVGVDTGIGDFFETNTLYRTKDDVRVKHFADNAVTVMVVTSLCFLHWLGVWTYFDRVIFPENLVMTVVASWIIGYAIVGASFMLEPLAIKISRTLDSRNKSIKTVFEDCFLLMSNVGVILIWRGHWVFFESLMYYFPIYHNGLDISAFYGLFSAFMMMCLLNTSSSLILKGCDFDGELTNGQGVSFGVDYFAVFFKEEIELEEQLEATEKRRKDQSKHTKNNNIQNKNTLDANKNISQQEKKTN